MVFIFLGLIYLVISVPLGTFVLLPTFVSPPGDHILPQHQFFVEDAHALHTVLDSNKVLFALDCRVVGQLDSIGIRNCILYEHLTVFKPLFEFCYQPSRMSFKLLNVLRRGSLPRERFVSLALEFALELLILGSLSILNFNQMADFLLESMVLKAGFFFDRVCA